VQRSEIRDAAHSCAQRAAARTHYGSGGHKVNTAQALEAIRIVEPDFREGMTPEELETELREVGAWDRQYDQWRFAGNRPKSEQLIDNKKTRKLEKARERNRRYYERKNKLKVVQ
jgi:hypothetical protein